VTREYHCDVIVVGGSLVGSAAAMFLDAAAWKQLYANTTTGGVLIRPDGIVGWCTDDAPPEPRTAVAAARARCLTYDDFPASRHIDIEGE
jgi:thioredoxin reductase